MLSVTFVSLLSIAVGMTILPRQGDDNEGRFIDTALSRDTPISIISSGFLGGSAQGSDSISIHWRNESGIAVDQTVLFKSGIGPIFDHIIPLKSTPHRVLAISWRTGGTGLEGYSLWLMQFDKYPVVIDYLEIIQARSFPGIDFDTTNGAIAIVINPRGYGSCSKSDEELSAQSSRKEWPNLCKLRSHPRKEGKWIPYSEHPFANERTPGMRTIAIFKPGLTGFE